MVARMGRAQSGAMRTAMERFVTQRNLDLYRLLASKATTADQRKKLLSSLAQDQADMKRELRDWLKRNQK